MSPFTISVASPLITIVGGPSSFSSTSVSGSAASEIELGEAIGWTKGTAGDGDPRAMYAYGLYALSGTGMEQNPAVAVEMFEQAAELDDTLAFFLGDMFETGKDLPQDLEKAKQWYRSAAERGNANAAVAVERLGAGLEANPAGQ